jgi:hypothetical protein
MLCKDHAPLPLLWMNESNLVWIGDGNLLLMGSSLCCAFACLPVSGRIGLLFLETNDWQICVLHEGRKDVLCIFYFILWSVNIWHFVWNCGFSLKDEYGTKHAALCGHQFSMSFCCNGFWGYCSQIFKCKSDWLWVLNNTNKLIILLIWP